MPKPVLSVIGSADAVSVTIPIPRIPQQIAVGAAALAVVFFLILVFRILSRFSKLHKEDSKEARLSRPRKPKEPDPHSVVAELQKALISEMKGTSRQNWLMISLTVIFSITSVAATLFASQISDFIGRLMSKAPQIFNIIKSFLQR